MCEKHNVVDGGRVPLKLWNTHGEFEPQAMDQLKNIAQMPFIHSHVAGMPDVHLGKGATVGSVIPTYRAIIPAAVGVDIGCGMVAVKTNLTANDMPDNLDKLRAEMEAVVPKGFESNQREGHLKGNWKNVNDRNAAVWKERFQKRWEDLISRHPKLDGHSVNQLGSMGGGNHFIEVCLDEDDQVWLMLHSGSRGLGNRIGTYFINAAKELMASWHMQVWLPDEDLSYIPEDHPLFGEYIGAMLLAQDFAMANRESMLCAIVDVMKARFPDFAYAEAAINCHHNYAEQEHHFGKNVWLTRKGAVRARKGDMGIIPGSMGTGSFIVRGLGNPDSFHSCSHGAGRVMSRNEAKKRITLEEHREAVKGISCRTDRDVIDESPAAYKDIGAVMAAQEDLVEIVARLRQIINIKG